MECSLETLDPDGDAVLLITGAASGRFLVSSKILTLASPVFAKLFTSGFREGNQMKDSTRPTLTLPEDSPGAMRTILQALHYQGSEDEDSLSARHLAVIAVHCDKYDCNSALRPWIWNWLGRFTHIETPEDHGYLLLAAYLFHCAEHYARLSIQAQINLPPRFADTWDEADLLGLLPSSAKGDLGNHIQKQLRAIHELLQAGEVALATDSSCARMDCRLCKSCENTYPATERKCPFCSSRQWDKEYCTRELRIAQYFDRLTRAGLWPSVRPFEKCSMAEIRMRISEAKGYCTHQCEGDPCPLGLQVKILVDAVEQAIAQTAALVWRPIHLSSTECEPARCSTDEIECPVTQTA
ncbi:uncharacterized protein BO66DRAFT_385159 [Aspergillus aculeatinus CBS 121060]|uniref:Uncharacterized protein n=1 Tax=Aspergillus aculeatinus CBS 121060 TaxID=1448322 RepID=A0ACD1GTU3_9EURO|nr:hypothetical protein BO66DRAFT_385159 [Aspergillus aculeatinus CBS 121060]RAH64558.1 hypothetical protein BO66DRAFT_385159 [Aspergillus aculeatinus CBS 121060]